MNVSITAKFTLPQTSTPTSSSPEENPVNNSIVTQTFDASNCQEALFGLPDGVTPTKAKINS